MTDEDRWTAWKEATFGSGYMIWHDGLDTGAVTRLTGEERDRALEMLRLGLALGDAHASEALAAMRDPASLATMRQVLEKSVGIDRVRTALAIHDLAPDPSLAKYLMEVLVAPLHWSHRIDAAIGLRHFSGAEDERALLEAVEHDPEYLVRNHAASSLLVRWKIEPQELTQHSELFGHICGPKDEEPMTPEWQARFKKAREMLERMKPR